MEYYRAMKKNGKTSKYRNRRTPPRHLCQREKDKLKTTHGDSAYVKHLNESVQMLYLNTQDSVSGDRKRGEGVWEIFHIIHMLLCIFLKILV